MTVYTTHPWSGFPSTIARQPRGCQYRTTRLPIPNDIYVFGKLSFGDIFPTQTFFFGTGGTIPTAVEISTTGNWPRGV